MFKLNYIRDGNIGYLKGGHKTMENEYDFSKAEQGKFYRPIEELEIPVYLDKKRGQARSSSPSFRKRAGDSQKSFQKRAKFHVFRTKT